MRIKLSHFHTVKTKTKSSDQKKSTCRLRWQLGLAFLTQLFGGGRVHAENQVEYGFEYYKEDGDRMTIETHSVYFEQKLTDYLDIKGDYTYDGISGSTPTGTVSSSGKVYMTQLEDIRRAISLQADCPVQVGAVCRQGLEIIGAVKGCGAVVACASPLELALDVCMFRRATEQ